MININVFQDVPGHVAGDDDYIYFDGPWTSMVKTITMFVGELEFSDIPIDPESSISWVSFCFLVIFVFFIVVILLAIIQGSVSKSISLISTIKRLLLFFIFQSLKSYIPSNGQPPSI